MPAASKKFDRQAVELPRYASIEQSAGSDMQRLVHRYISGEQSRAQTLRGFASRMAQAQTDALVAGRRARGDLRGDLNDGEREMLKNRLTRQQEFFRNFIHDIDHGRGKVDYLRRAAMYGESLWSIYTRGESSDWDRPETVNARYMWVLDPDAEHCDDCRRRAAESIRKGGFSWDEMVAQGWPGENTRCGRKCRCHVRVVKKRLVLPERLEDLKPAPTAPEGLQAFEQLMGGPSMPLALPAAGVPYVKVDPGELTEILDALPPKESDLVAAALPVLPKALTAPTALDLQGPVRAYGSPDVTAWVQRRGAGWWLAGLAAGILAGILGRDDE
jgi:hypothetical protein